MYSTVVSVVPVSQDQVRGGWMGKSAVQVRTEFVMTPKSEWHTPEWLLDGE